MDKNDDGGRQPEQRFRAVAAIANLEAAQQSLLLLSEWDNVDLLPIDEADRLLTVCNGMQHALAEVCLQAAKAHAKRTGQSVSGRLQPQIDAYRRSAQAVIDIPSEVGGA